MISTDVPPTKEDTKTTCESSTPTETAANINDSSAKSNRNSTCVTNDDKTNNIADGSSGSSDSSSADHVHTITNNNKWYNMQARRKYITQLFTDKQMTMPRMGHMKMPHMTLPRMPKFIFDHFQLMVIMLLIVIALVLNIIAMGTKSWTCDPNNNTISFGLWDTCFEQTSKQITNETIHSHNETWMANNDTWITPMSNNMVCAHQEIDRVDIESSEQSRIVQVYAAQGIFIYGLVLFVVLMCMLFYSWNYVEQNNLMTIRNVLVASIFTIIEIFIVMLIGFFMFINSEHISLSVCLICIYFGLAILSSNMINFITIEMKIVKLKQYN
jgi:hypothetical protein